LAEKLKKKKRVVEVKDDNQPDDDQPDTSLYDLAADNADKYRFGE
jgi:hypothetical protein